MPVTTSRLASSLIAAAAALWLGCAAPAASAEEAVAQPPAAAGATGEASAAPTAEQSLEEGAVELNEAPASVVPGYGGEAPMCPHHRGKAELPAV